MTNEKTNWKNFDVFSDRVMLSTEKSALIRFPADSELKDYKFWYPNKFIRKSRSGKLAKISYTETYKTKIFKEEYQDGSYVKVDEKELTGVELANAFAKMDAQIKNYKKHE